MVLHIQCVSEARHSCKLSRSNATSLSRQVLDDFSCRIRFSRIHAGTGYQHQWSCSFERFPRRDSAFGYIHQAAVTYGHAYNFHFNGVAQAVVMTNAPANKPAQVQKVKPIPRGNAFGHVANKSLERASVSKHAGDNVT